MDFRVVLEEHSVRLVEWELEEESLKAVAFGRLKSRYDGVGGRVGGRVGKSDGLGVEYEVVLEEAGLLILLTFERSLSDVSLLNIGLSVHTL